MSEDTRSNADDSMQSSIDTATGANKKTPMCVVNELAKYNKVHLI